MKVLSKPPVSLPAPNPIERNQPHLTTLGAAPSAHGSRLCAIINHHFSPETSQAFFFGHRLWTARYWTPRIFQNHIGCSHHTWNILTYTLYFFFDVSCSFEHNKYHMKAALLSCFCISPIHLPRVPENLEWAQCPFARTVSKDEICGYLHFHLSGYRKCPLYFSLQSIVKISKGNHI